MCSSDLKTAFTFTFLWLATTTTTTTTTHNRIAVVHPIHALIFIKMNNAIAKATLDTKVKIQYILYQTEFPTIEMKIKR